MGCDIHVHVEVKINGEWLYYNHPPIERWYALFSLLAGVRGKKPPTLPPKGLPNDATRMTMLHLERYEDNHHDATYLTFDDIIAVRREVKLCLNVKFDALFGYLFGNNFTAFREAKHCGPEGLEDVRIIFWFDN